MTWMAFSLQGRLRQWIEEEAGEEAADTFAPLIAEELGQSGYPSDTIGDQEWEAKKEALLDAGLTPALIRQAADETRRAREKEWTLREWLRDAFSRVLPQDVAEQRASIAEQMIEEAPEANPLDEPPQPEDVLSYRWMLSLIGGGASLAAAREQMRGLEGGLPRN